MTHVSYPLPAVSGACGCPASATFPAEPGWNESDFEIACFESFVGESDGVCTPPFDAWGCCDAFACEVTIFDGLICQFTGAFFPWGVGVVEFGCWGCFGGFVGSFDFLAFFDTQHTFVDAVCGVACAEMRALDGVAGGHAAHGCAGGGDPPNASGRTAGNPRRRGAENASRGAGVGIGCIEACEQNTHPARSEHVGIGLVFNRAVRRAARELAYGSQAA